MSRTIRVLTLWCVRAGTLGLSSSSRSNVFLSGNSFSSQVEIALQAVRKASVITKKLQDQIDIVTLTKQDASPVTVADFSSQAVVLQHLKTNFPCDVFLAEESSDALTDPVSQLILEACNASFQDVKELKECIDLGQSFFQNDSRTRVWCLDPIDGTKGFLRKQQYCIALALLEDGIPTIGILACPNLPFDADSVGCIFVAVKGEGCYQLALEESSYRRRLEKLNTVLSPSLARFCVGIEEGFSDPVGKCKKMAKLLHGKLAEDGEILYSARMDSQAKYGVIARGDAEFYVRLPKSEYREWVWDVAPGTVVLEEMGGIVTDTDGNCLDFTKGAKLTSNGILGAIDAGLHQALLDAYRK